MDDIHAVDNTRDSSTDILFKVKLADIIGEYIVRALKTHMCIL